MTDPRIDELAEALHAGGIGPTSVDGHWLCQGVEHHTSDATLILEYLPPGWCGHPASLVEAIRQIALLNAEIARLRKIEEEAER